MKALTAAMRQEGAHLWITRLWQNNYLCELETFCLCCTHANAWSWSLHPPVFLCQVLSKPSQGKRVLQGSTSRSISDLERRSCWTRQTQIWLSDALMLCESTGGLIEFKLLGTDDQQIKCCSSPPPSSRQVLVNPVLSHLSKMCFYWSRQGLACITSISNTLGEIWQMWKPCRSVGNVIMAENVTQRKEEDKEKKQNFTNYVREFVGEKIKANCHHIKARFRTNAF